MAGAITISDELQIPESEVSFRYSRSSGPGGQNVNKVATKVTLLFDLSASTSIDDDARAKLLERLAGRISAAGVLHVTSQRHRTRSANQRDAVARFSALVAGALEERRPRRPTRVPAGVRRHRLADKRRRGAIKDGRRRPDEGDG